MKSSKIRSGRSSLDRSYGIWQCGKDGEMNTTLFFQNKYRDVGCLYCSAWRVDRGDGEERRDRLVGYVANQEQALGNSDPNYWRWVGNLLFKLAVLEGYTRDVREEP